MWKGYNFGNNCYFSNVTINSFSNKALDQKEKYHNSNEMVLFFSQIKQHRTEKCTN